MFFSDWEFIGFVLSVIGSVFLVCWWVSLPADLSSISLENCCSPSACYKCVQLISGAFRNVACYIWSWSGIWFLSLLSDIEISLLLGVDDVLLTYHHFKDYSPETCVLKRLLQHCTAGDIVGHSWSMWWQRSIYLATIGKLVGRKYSWAGVSVPPSKTRWSSFLPLGSLQWGITL